MKEEKAKSLFEAFWKPYGLEREGLDAIDGLYAIVVALHRVAKALEEANENNSNELEVVDGKV